VTPALHTSGSTPHGRVKAPGTLCPLNVSFFFLCGFIDPCFYFLGHQTVFRADAIAIGDAMAKTDPTVGMTSSCLQMGVVATSPDDNDVLEVVMGHPCLQAPVQVSLLKAMDMAYSKLRQVWHVLQQECDELEVE
jgi:hypothetical protein